MLMVRDAQMAVFGRIAEAAFCERAVGYLRRTVPEVCAGMSHEHLLESVKYAIARCRALGSEREIDVLRYLNLMYVFGFQFERLPWAKRILTQTSMHPRARMNWLNGHGLYVASQRARHVAG